MSERVFNCEHCGFSCTRELNASLNLAMAGSLLRNASANRPCQLVDWTGADVAR
ncbi:hypothetical protein [Okeania sp. SIO2B3]|uniref:hypothetical protein n=1 Tax=Okeania sp. SIO2B3 TaxID=2607784 RepID=UPI0025E9CBF2|nr:hypothetical protein [Okeania sp. SIO2B3]